MALEGNLIIKDCLRYAENVTDVSSLKYFYYDAFTGGVTGAGNAYNNLDFYEPWGRPYIGSNIFPSNFYRISFASTIIQKYENTLPNYGPGRDNSAGYYKDCGDSGTLKWFIEARDINWCLDCIDVNEKIVNPDWDQVDAVLTSVASDVNQHNVQILEDLGVDVPSGLSLGNDRDIIKILVDDVRVSDDLSVQEQAHSILTTGEWISQFYPEFNSLFGHCREGDQFEKVSVQTNEPTFGGAFHTSQLIDDTAWTYAGRMSNVFPRSVLGYATNECPNTRVFNNKRQILWSPP